MKRHIRPDGKAGGWDFERHDGEYTADGHTVGVAPNEGVIGIDEEGNVTGGCDGALPVITLKGNGRDVVAMDFGFTDNERRELAEHMIARWKKWGGL